MTSSTTDVSGKIPPKGEKREDSWSQMLVRVGAQRDQMAFKSLFDHFAPLIKGFCLNNTNQAFAADAAEEIVQEVMLKVWQKAPMYDPNKAAASTWIYTVMRNARIDMIRRNKNHKHDPNPVDVDDLWDDDSPFAPVLQFQRARDQEMVHESLKALPPEQRAALMEVYMRGKSHSEVAIESGLPLGTVKSRVRMGLQKVQQQLTHRFALVGGKNDKASS